MVVNHIYDFCLKDVWIKSFAVSARGLIFNRMPYKPSYPIILNVFFKKMGC
jgi:hypothetical protein